MNVRKDSSEPKEESWGRTAAAGESVASATALTNSSGSGGARLGSTGKALGDNIGRRLHDMPIKFLYQGAYCCID